MLTTSWRSLGRYHALVEINTRLGHEQLRRLHEPVFELITPLLIRGQQTGGFNPELPIAWMLTARLELVHAASLSVTNGAPAPDQAQRALVDCTLGALEPRQASRG